MANVNRRKQNNERFQVPLMFAFRDAFREGDSKLKADERLGGERVIAERASFRRRGVNEAVLKENLAIDLVSLANTIDLESAVPLEDLEYVRRSVINYGLRDVGHLTSEEVGVEDISKNLMTALLQHEPRLHPDSLFIDRKETFDDVNQRIRFTVSAEMSCRPFDVPIEFVAEVEVSSGKVQLTRLPIST